ncbi:hypothetical protein FM125_04095 [Micrococcus lylae]|uniref:Uncharacterized protein n=1 Tax=Micrococcus lylae TaxID=1273 RepID=A0A1R4IRN9_9MICC|nr:hypothetical protein FM125_04095 [Micrococcus lylae]
MRAVVGEGGAPIRRRPGMTTIEPALPDAVGPSVRRPVAGGMACVHRPFVPGS